MSYKHQAAQSQPKSASAQKLATALLAALPMMTVLSAATALSGCGFQLRGYDTPMLFDVAKTAVIVEDDRTSFPLKLPLTRRLEALGVDVIDNMTLTDVANNNQSTDAAPIAAITVKNIRFKR
ncbi:hypothetical protein ACS8FD_22875, partial [Psychrobacter sp. 1U2]